MMTPTEQDKELRDSDTAYDIALTCYHAGSMVQRGKTIHPGTVQEWTDRITAYTNAEIAKVLDRLESKGLNEDGGSRYVNTPDGYVAATAWNEAQDRVERAIEAERNKLNNSDGDVK